MPEVDAEVQYAPDTVEAAEERSITRFVGFLEREIGELPKGCQLRDLYGVCKTVIGPSRGPRPVAPNQESPDG